MPKPPSSIHDAFFKQLMGDPAMAGQFLRERLPPTVAALLGDYGDSELFFGLRFAPPGISLRRKTGYAD